MLTIRTNGVVKKNATKVINKMIQQLSIEESSVKALDQAGIQSTENDVSSMKETIETCSKLGEGYAFINQKYSLYAENVPIVADFCGRKITRMGTVAGFTIAKVIYLGDDLFAFVNNNNFVYIVPKEGIGYYYWATFSSLAPWEMPYGAIFYLIFPRASIIARFLIAVFHT